MTPDHIEPQSTNWKSRLKFLLPHMALLLATFGYAAVGATLFQRIEQPHETAVHQSSLELIKLQKKQLINRMITTAKNGTSKAVWKETVEKDLLKLTETLYKASQEAYVTAKSLSGGDKESVWSFTASLFFAFTTMATIGYGNVVPITPNGRLMCVGFALIGTPLVIVLIADLGKFFSEFTVRSYQAYQRGKHRLTKCLRFLMKRLRVQLNPHTHPTVTNHIVDNNNVEVRLTCEDEEENPTVPVGVVCGVLLSYMGFGALLFALLEDWSTLDGFYFCFITLTTVGFGDMVPKTKDYKLAIILVYILVGLALTTMCVDLVGVRYIERIHHFGRRFERADLRALLRKRKRIERRLKLKMLSEATTRDRLQPTPAKTPEVNLIEAIGIIEPPDIPEWPCLKPEKSQEVLVFQESPSMDTMSTCSSVYQREVMYPTNALHPGFWLKSTSSWLASGPDLNRCPSAISTEPSVFEREKMYGTLAILTWPQSDELLVDWIPSPIIDFEEMASAAKSQRKVSCPGLFFSQFELFQPKPMKRPVDIPLIRTTLPSSSNSIISTPASTVSDMVMAEEVNFSLGFPVQSVSSESLRSPMVYYQNLPIFVQTNEAVTSEGAIIGAMSCSEKRISGETPKTVTDNVCFVLDGDKVKLTELLADDRWKQTGQPTQYYQSDDLRTFHKVQVIISRGRPIRAKFAQPEATETRSKVVKSSGEDSLDVPLTQVYKVTRYYSFWRSCAGFHRIITIITPTVESDDFKRRFFVQYLWRKASDADRIRVGLEFHQSE